jgi:hypothetical protein
MVCEGEGVKACGRTDLPQRAQALWGTSRPGQLQRQRL